MLHANCPHHRYFLIKHRGERRGLGGIFFENENKKSPEEHLAFATDCAAAVTEAYLPVIKAHKVGGVSWFREGPGGTG